MFQAVKTWCSLATLVIGCFFMSVMSGWMIPEWWQEWCSLNGQSGWLDWTMTAAGWSLPVAVPFFLFVGCFVVYTTTVEERWI